ncbi:hypothetical protein Smp_147530 [Schistosoma mansoni]|uniref:hypothetical protein n=1 Tax=Schistosoma mansoni TaxID=6183 RepID=UPI0001A63F05|nr:hypothetical protein Smp_147530 [Schistosoma mansoni]|eukprot:XP_018654744.1 hypothetical protein Smp_147530 [Schistosoma mansoni]
MIIKRIHDERHKFTLIGEVNVNGLSLTRLCTCRSPHRYGNWKRDHMPIVRKMDTDGLLVDCEANSIKLYKPSYPYTKTTLTRRHFANNQHRPGD